MAIGQQTFSDAGGAVSDIFGALGASSAASMKAKGLQIQSEGTEITAQSLLLKAQGDIAEGQEYDLAAALAEKNADYTRQSTAIQQTQLDRQISMTIGGQKAGFAGAGLAESGSALDLLRDSASQGAIAKDVLARQGLIQEAGYEEQAQSYQLLSSTAKSTAAGETNIAGEEEGIAKEQLSLANQAKSAGTIASIGDFAGSLIKGAAAVATFA